MHRILTGHFRVVEHCKEAITRVIHVSNIHSMSRFGDSPMALILNVSMDKTPFVVPPSGGIALAFRARFRLKPVLRTCVAKIQNLKKVPFGDSQNGSSNHCPGESSYLTATQTLSWAVSATVVSRSLNGNLAFHRFG